MQQAPRSLSDRALGGCVQRRNRLLYKSSVRSVLRARRFSASLCALMAKEGRRVLIEMFS